MSRRALTALLLALMMVGPVTTGCFGRGASSPKATLRAYGDAIAEGRADEAYAMLSDDAKRSITPEAFRKLVKDNRKEALELGRSLAKDSGDPYVTAVVPLKNGDAVTMVYEDGKWRVEGQALDFYSQATPRQAIVGFIRAWDNKRFDVLLRYTPDAHKEGLTADRLASAWAPGKEEHTQLQNKVETIKQGLTTAQIEETGDRATMAVGSSMTVMFVREKGAWKIEDIH